MTLPMTINCFINYFMKIFEHLTTIINFSKYVQQRLEAAAPGCPIYKDTTHTGPVVLNFTTET